jgi:lipopolysaccharide transport system permease protein
MPQTVITPHKTIWTYTKELWTYRNVFVCLALRDILVYYRQTVIGVVWVLLKPLLMVLFFTLIFGRLVSLPAHGVPYFLIVFSGMLVWQFFLDSFMFGSGAFLASQELITKIYFPRIFIPSSRIICSLLDFFVLLCCFLLIGCFRYSALFSYRLLLIPVGVLWLTIITLAASLLFGSLIVLYRDFRHVLQFVSQLGLYMSPIGFLSSVIPPPWRAVLSLNPLCGVIDLFRWMFFNFPCDLLCIIISLMSTGFISVVSIAYFLRVEDRFADIV